MSSDIKEEAVDSRAEVKSFDHSKLKHVETQEKVTLPGPGGLYSTITDKSSWKGCTT